MLTEIKQGKTIPPLVKHITQEKINLYAEASGDFNPIHIDESFATSTPFAGTIAHGMLILAYVSETMTLAFGQSWLNGGKLSARFKESARPGDTITINSIIDSITEQNGVSYANCSFRCCNQKDETIILGDVSVRFSAD